MVQTEGVAEPRTPLSHFLLLEILSALGNGRGPPSASRGECVWSLDIRAGWVVDCQKPQRLSPLAKVL